jgi:hypothetical protein
MFLDVVELVKRQRSLFLFFTVVGLFMFHWLLSKNLLRNWLLWLGEY